MRSTLGLVLPLAATLLAVGAVAGRPVAVPRAFDLVPRAEEPPAPGTAVAPAEAPGVPPAPVAAAAPGATPWDVICAGREGVERAACEFVCIDWPRDEDCALYLRFGRAGQDALRRARDPGATVESAAAAVGLPREEAHDLVLFLDATGLLPHRWVDERTYGPEEQRVLWSSGTSTTEQRGWQAPTGSGSTRPAAGVRRSRLPNRRRISGAARPSADGRSRSGAAS